MAINPNTDFTAGAILTAAQQNRFPRGVMAYDQRTTDTTGASSEVITITGSSFTAVANRYYKITYNEPLLNTDTSSEKITMRVRLTNISGAIQQETVHQVTGSVDVTNTKTLTVIKTFSAGSVVLVATVASASGFFNAYRNSTNIGFLLVEDIGPA